VTAEQDYIDALNPYAELHKAHGAILDQMITSKGIRLSMHDLERLSQLGEIVEAARQDTRRGPIMVADGRRLTPT
jgi:hypothetical protein